MKLQQVPKLKELSDAFRKVMLCVTLRVELKKEVLTNASEISAHICASVYLCTRSHLLHLIIESVVLVC